MWSGYAISGFLAAVTDRCHRVDVGIDSQLGEGITEWTDWLVGIVASERHEIVQGQTLIPQNGDAGEERCVAICQARS